MITIGKWIKNWCVIFATSNPYQIVPFKNICTPAIGAPLDLPESTTAILKEQQGEIIIYDQEPQSLTTAINLRYTHQKLRYQLSGIFKEPDRYVFSIADGCIIGQLGLVYHPGKRSFLDESAREWKYNIKDSAYVTAFHLPEKKYLNGITFSFLTIGAEAGFYHFLFEAVTKTGMYKSLLPHADHLLFNGPPTPWKLKWLNRAQIDVSKIIWVDGRSHYECQQLIFTNRLIADQQISHWCINTLKSTFKVNITPALMPEHKKVVMISRKGLASRDITWEKDILNNFPGIELADLSQLNVEETMRVLQEASHVIGAHGAGLSNIYLCRPGTKILELYPRQVTFQPCYQRIAIVCQLQYALANLNFEDKLDPETGLAAFTDILKGFLC